MVISCFSLVHILIFSYVPAHLNRCSSYTGSICLRLIWTFMFAFALIWFKVNLHLHKPVLAFFLPLCLENPAKDSSLYDHLVMIYCVITSSHGAIHHLTNGINPSVCRRLPAQCHGELWLNPICVPGQAP